MHLGGKDHLLRSTGSHDGPAWDLTAGMVNSSLDFGKARRLIALSTNTESTFGYEAVGAVWRSRVHSFLRLSTVDMRGCVILCYG